MEWMIWLARSPSEFQPGRVVEHARQQAFLNASMRNRGNRLIGNKQTLFGTTVVLGD